MGNSVTDWPFLKFLIFCGVRSLKIFLFAQPREYPSCEYYACHCLPCEHIVASEHGLLENIYTLMVIGCVVCTVGSSY